MVKILNMIGLAVRAGKVKFGVFSASLACDKGQAQLVVIPSDLGGSNKRSIEGKCKSTLTPIIVVGDKEALSKACGRENVTAVAICDENFKSAILKLHGGGVNG